jgi:hypothetical protein
MSLFIMPLMCDARGWYKDLPAFSIDLLWTFQEDFIDNWKYPKEVVGDIPPDFKSTYSS